MDEFGNPMINGVTIAVVDRQRETVANVGSMYIDNATGGAKKLVKTSGGHFRTLDGNRGYK